ncbi:fagellar hook-basal body protein [Arcobacter nitrofigilis DSM 7299]|uniref:Fagellar hook-basal body protein n=1 Tax=Arcobacter nitrofigilis (strain ATCC 33309 / DSM 7299 / CCUG 15893 / LMG 7604 / NCTC 12251 / CI) TaxID=572480 RepID=D5V675_ARCNC|nr:flagellar hook-basal body complex protein [Arcobacter nitrofigilis]ADG94145.1 fagellar hook-basal body protein [Arcobacter nitrofigilis DSM 7299]
MIGALWTGISGLSAQQKALDNESHNIANVNTIGYKASRISFADQMYQDKIGKGAKVQDAEKIYTPSGTKSTGVAYDMALKDHGFFAVSNKTSTGTSETYYTRAGNFRMGDNGTLQDAGGNEVQGWAMSPITADDIVSTNANVNVFTNDYSNLIATDIIKHGTYIESYSAKMTDFDQVNKGDDVSVYSGYGIKSKASKENDVKELVKNYKDALSNYNKSPGASSQEAVAQVSQINFLGTEITKEKSKLTVYIDGSPISVEYQVRAARKSDDGTTDLTSIEASQIATYKALADEISKHTGYRAYTITDENIDGKTETGSAIDSFESFDTFTKSTKDKDVLRGMIQIEGMIPGKEFKVTDPSEDSGSGSPVFGSVNGTTSRTVAKEGIGLGGLVSARDALARAISGNQRDVYTMNELNLNGKDSYSFKFSAYDKDLGKTINFGSSINVSPTTNVDTIISNLTSGTSPAVENFNKYFTALNINGNLVIEAKEYDIEFSSELFADSQTYVASASGSSYNFSGQNAILANSQTSYTIEIPQITLSNGQTIPAITASGGTINSPADLDIFKGKLNDIFANQKTTGGAPAKMPYKADIINGNLVITRVTGASGAPAANFPASLTINKIAGGIDKNAVASGRKGAGGEFLEIKTTLDQTSAQNSLQLRLDTLNISDSPFGDFSVDKTGLITMQQDGAKFIIGQVSVALFNNERGLLAVGDNLLKKTTESGEPTYNINNDRTSEIAGGNLELSGANLSESLVNLMVFQRAFEANAKSITTADALLTTLIQLKR